MDILCKQCKKTKPVEEFYRSKNTKSGYRGKCKSCTNEDNNSWYAENIDTRRETIKAWDKANSDQRNAYFQEYRAREENKARAKEHSDAWYLANRDKALARQKQARLDNPEYERSRTVAKGQRRRARILQSGGNLPANAVLIIKECYGDQCLRCDKKEITLDHVVPLIKGGRNALENLQPLCKSCNSWKHDKTIDFRPFVFIFDDPSILTS